MENKNYLIHFRNKYIYAGNVYDALRDIKYAGGYVSAVVKHRTLIGGSVIVSTNNPEKLKQLLEKRLHTKVTRMKEIKRS